MAIKAFKLGKDNWARTRPTKEGMVFLGLSVFVGFAAMNTGNNLLYLTFGMMLSFVAASGFMSMINLSGIEVTNTPPGEIFAMRRTPLRFTLHNLKAVVPSFSLTVALDGSTGHVQHLPSRGSKRVDVPHVFRQRGWSTLPEAQLYTRFPFGFFKKWIRVDTQGDRVLVYPRIVSMDIDPLSYRESTGDGKSHTHGYGSEIRSLRDYSPGDNPKFIHWKISAKLDKVMLKELEEEESDTVCLSFEPSGSPAALEGEITRCASLFMELMKTGLEVVVKTPDKTFTARGGGRSPHAVLAYLALYERRGPSS